MKIIYVENVRIPSERAHAYQIVQTCAWLSRLGHDVVLVNPDRAGGKDVFDAYGLQKNLFHHKRITSWDPLTIWPVAKALAYNLQRWAFTRALRQWASSSSADAWVTRDAAMIDALRDVVKGPWILESHDTPDADAARWERIKHLVTAHIAISEGMADRLAELGVPRDRILVAQDGYDPEEFEHCLSREEARKELGVPADAFVAFYPGSFYPWKGIDLAVQTWEKTPSDWHLVLIGGPEGDRARLNALIASAVRGRVHLLPAKSRAELVRLYPAADVGLLTSSPAHDIARRYTSPLKQFEYLAARLPVVASDVPSSREILTDVTARFFKPTSEGLLTVLQDVAQDPAWRAAASAAGPQCVQPYSWERRTQRVADWIKKAVSAYHPPNV